MSLKENIAYSAEYDNYLKQYEYIFHHAYYTHQTIIELPESYKLSIDDYNHSYNVSDKFGYSISCQKFVLLNQLNKNYDVPRN